MKSVDLQQFHKKELNITNSKFHAAVEYYWVIFLSFYSDFIQRDICCCQNL